MNKSINYVIGAVAVIALITAFTYNPSKVITGAQGPQGPRGEQGVPGPAGKDGVTTVITKTEAPKLGSVAGPDFFGPYQAQNNVKTIADRTIFRSATTTVCSFPVVATSSLSFVSVQIASTSAQATVYAIGTSTTNFATTSVVTTFPSLAANARGEFVWYNSSNGTSQLGNISPGTFVNISVAGVTGGSPGGACQFDAKVF